MGCAGWNRTLAADTPLMALTETSGAQSDHSSINRPCPLLRIVDVLSGDGSSIELGQEQFPFRAPIVVSAEPGVELSSLI